MAKRLVENEIVKLDYGTFEETRFVGCKLIFGGGRPPSLAFCEFESCEFIFEGPALNTMQFIAAMAHGGGGGADLVVHRFLGLPKDWAAQSD